jgi:hypothetical protein
MVVPAHPEPVTAGGVDSSTVAPTVPEEGASATVPPAAERPGAPPAATPESGPRSVHDLAVLRSAGRPSPRNPVASDPGDQVSGDGSSTTTATPSTPEARSSEERVTYNVFGAVSDIEEDEDDETAPGLTWPATSMEVAPPVVSAGPRTAVSVLGLRMYCYRCGEVTTVIAGVCIPPDDGTHRLGQPSDPPVTQWRYLPLSLVAVPLAAALPPDWFRLVSAGTVTLRYSVDVGPEPAWANGCMVCDAMLADPPVQVAFTQAVTDAGEFQSFMLHSVDLPVVDLEQALRAY